MNTKITLSIEKRVIDVAKEYAKEKGQSLSEIVENYFKMVTSVNNKLSDKDLSPSVRKLRGVIKHENIPDYKEVLLKDLSKKNDLLSFHGL